MEHIKDQNHTDGKDCLNNIFHALSPVTAESTDILLDISDQIQTGEESLINVCNDSNLNCHYNYLKKNGIGYGDLIIWIIGLVSTLILGVIFIVIVGLFIYITYKNETIRQIVCVILGLISFVALIAEGLWLLIGESIESSFFYDIIREILKERNWIDTNGCKKAFICYFYIAIYTYIMLFVCDILIILIEIYIIFVKNDFSKFSETMAIFSITLIMLIPVIFNNAIRITTIPLRVMIAILFSYVFKDWISEKKMNSYNNYFNHTKN